ncbi:MAG: tetratricopeptide repeat protein, partial [Thermoguttaceae bacterium]
MQTIRFFDRFRPLAAGRLGLAILAFTFFASGTPLSAANTAPAKSWAELMAERERWGKQFSDFVAAGKTDEAIAAIKKVITADRQALAILASNESEKKRQQILRQEVLGGLKWLIRAHLHAEAWSAAAARQGEIADTADADLGKTDYRAVDVRNDQIYFQRLASLKSEDARGLLKAAGMVAKTQELESQGKYSEAIPLLQEALNLQRQFLGYSSPILATSLNNLASLYQHRGDYARAEPLYRQALEIRKKVLGENHPGYAVSLNNLAGLYKAQGDYARAEPLYRQALEIRKKVLGENHSSYATTVNNLADLYRHQGEYARAEPLYRQALEIVKNALGENHPHYASSLNNLAGLYQDQGEYARAEPLFLQALEITKKVLGENHPDYAGSLNSLAELYRAHGDYARAEPLFRQASEIWKKVLGENHPDYATSLNNLAELYRAQGDYARAEPLLRQASEIWKKVLGENHPYYATSLNNLALLYQAQGDYARAEPFFLQALEIRKKVLGENHPNYATSLNNLAGLYKAQGDYARAEPLFRQALEIAKKALGEDHPQYALSVNNLAALYAAQGDYARAEPLLRQCQEIRKKVLGENHPDYAISLINLAYLYFYQGDNARAEPLYRQATKTIRTHIEATSIVQSERQQLAMLQANRWYLNGYVDLAAGSGRFAAAVYGESLAWKGIVLRRNRLTRAGTQSPELLETFTRLQRVTTQLTCLAWATPDPKQEANWLERTAKLFSEKEQLEAQLLARSAEYRQAKRQVTLEEVQTALPQDSVLIDFIEYEHYTPADKNVGTKEAWERRLLGFVLAPGRSVEMVPLGPMQP